MTATDDHWETKPTVRRIEHMHNGEVSHVVWWDTDPNAAVRFRMRVMPGHVTPFGQIVPAPPEPTP